ncbi:MULTISPECIES: DUF2087 domain-containing protein [Bacillus]|uniref:Transcriptional regulator n=1 Tax=Bacillus infantis NRRL B-14911 TaxID=1367477 RepID=U5LB07_9BACI|nr:MULTISPECIES: DUF2087 domain-containing protein [Bacillus]AGX04610.1 transcriptional regulator [Bacillus infantis NRRL B-14911]EAR68322.1 Transcriptional regulator [Bacillus sp. NRRL B-14911]MCP1158701.1 DUF2087 domain-containing protein [Bacillus infantis]
MPDISASLWEASLEEIKKGYREESESFLCLLCGEKFDKGIVYPYENLLYEAERYTRLHIERSHSSVFDYLLGLDKKWTGVTEHQSQLLRLFYQGMADKEVQAELGIGSASTIRHHRFALKEKERQAKAFLAVMELLREKDRYAPAFIPPHIHASMVDDRYAITEEEQQKIVDKFLPNGIEGGLVKFPPKEKQRLAVIREISKLLKAGIVYSEKELNSIIESIYEDYALIRRYLIEYGLLDRKADGSAYWLKR